MKRIERREKFLQAGLRFKTVAKYLKSDFMCSILGYSYPGLKLRLQKGDFLTVQEVEALQSKMNQFFEKLKKLITQIDGQSEASSSEAQSDI